MKIVRVLAVGLVVVSLVLPLVVSSSVLASPVIDPVTGGNWIGVSTFVTCGSGSTCTNTGLMIDDDTATVGWWTGSGSRAIIVAWPRQLVHPRIEVKTNIDGAGSWLRFLVCQTSNCSTYIEIAGYQAGSCGTNCLRWDVDYDFQWLYIEANSTGNQAAYLYFAKGCDIVVRADCDVVATNTPTATATLSPTVTFTPSPTALPLVGGLGSFASWCPTETAPFGNTYSRQWMVACGCVIGQQSPFIPTSTATLAPSATATETPPVQFTATYTPEFTATFTSTATATATATRTNTPRPSVTATDYLEGSTSYDAFATATAQVAHLTAVAAYTPTLSAQSSGVSIVEYCSAPILRPSVVAVELVNYMDTVCLPSVPGGEFSVPASPTIFGYSSPAVSYGWPEVTICLERYSFPRLALLGFELPIEWIVVFGLSIAWFLRQIGKL